MEKAHASSQPFVLVERSIFSDRLVFVEAMYSAKHMSDYELTIYDHLWNNHAQSSRVLPDGFVYLKVDRITHFD